MQFDRSHLDRQDWLWLLLVTTLAAVLRLVALERLPPGFHFDEAYNALDALEVLAGNHRLFLPANGGREILYTYLQAPFVAWLGPTVLAMRIPSAIIGSLTVGVLYIFVRRVWPERRRLAVLAAVLLTFSFWHLHFSRYGIRSILTPFWCLLTLSSLWRGITEDRLGWYVLCGVFLAAGVWSHPAGRLMPIVVVAVALAACRAGVATRRRLLLGTAVAALTSLLLFAPLAWHYWHNLIQFYAHASDVAIFQPGDPRATIKALAENAWRLVLMFNVRGDAEGIHNLPGRPAFAPLTGIAFLVGGVLTLVHAVGHSARDRMASWMLLIWSLCLMIVSVCTDMAPNFSRMIGALPAFIIVAALGLDWLATQLARRAGQRVAQCALAGVLLLGAGQTCVDYFVRFDAQATAGDTFGASKIEVAELLSTLDEDNTVFLAELWAQYATIKLLTRDTGIRALDTNGVAVLPTAEGKGVVYAYPYEQLGRAQALAETWAGWGQLEPVYDTDGDVQLYLFTIPAERLQGLNLEGDIAQQLPLGLESLDLELEEAIALRGWGVAPHADAEGYLTITLLWECLAPVDQNLTGYVHLVGRSGYTVAQLDQQPGGGSYATKEWHVGDLVIDTYRIELPEAMAAGDYAIQVGLYRLNMVGDMAQADLIAVDAVGSFTFDGVVPVKTDVLTTGTPIGATLPEQIELSAPTDLTFILSPTFAASGATWQLRLVDVGSHDVYSLQELTLAQNAAWIGAEALALTVRLTVAGVPTGSYCVQLLAKDQETPTELGVVSVVPSQRVWSLPEDIDLPVWARLGGWVSLAGVSTQGWRSESISAVPGQALMLTLVWQATGETEQSLTTFVHLVDAEGQIVVQHDGIARNGTYPTPLWLTDEVVTDTVMLALPANLAAGRYTLLVGLYDPLTGERQSVVQDGQEAPSGAVIVPAPVIVSGN